MFRWTEKSLDWYVRAGLAGTYFQRQAALLAPYLTPGGHVGDLGCGPGLLSLELARLGFTVTGMDIEERAVAWLRAEAARRGLASVRAVPGDALALPAGVLYDDLVLSLFGGLASADLDPAGAPADGPGGPCGIEYFLAHARHRVLIVVNTDPGRKRGRSGRACAPDMERALRARAIPFERVDMALDFGQPLQSEEEAVAFVSHYGEVDGDRLAWKLARLEQRPDGTCFLPHVKELSLFAFPVQGGSTRFPRPAGGGRLTKAAKYG